MTSARLIIGDSLEVLRKMPDASVDLVVTSPPFLALRSYLPADHPDKGKEIGSEPTPGAFLDALLDLTEEWARVLAPHGSICVELGDTYSGSGGAGGDYGADGLRESQPKFVGTAAKGRRKAKTSESGAYGASPDDKTGKYSGRQLRPFGTNGGDGWPEAKSLCLIPELYRFALAYGFNPLTGRTTPPWRVRNVVRWHRPNPPVGALGDKFRPATSDMVVACKSRSRYFDLDAVRTDYKGHARLAKGVTERPRTGKSADRGGNFDTLPERGDDGPGAPPLDTWIIPTAPYKGSHYATFPPALVTRPILSMCPERVCRVCGEPSRRETEASYIDGQGRPQKWSSGAGAHSSKPDGRFLRQASTTGWTDCGHDDYRPGVVLDPFAGSGTTLAVATGMGRDAIGIDLDERNADLVRDRVGMFLEVEG